MGCKLCGGDDSQHCRHCEPDAVDSPVQADTDQGIIESLIDRYGLSAFLELVEIVCNEKAEHLETNWDERDTAYAWQQMATRMGTASGAAFSKGLK